MPPVIPTVFRVALDWTHDDVPLTAENVMHFSSAGGDVAGLVAAFTANANDDLWRQTGQASHIHSLTVQELDGVSAAQQFPTGDTADYSGHDTNNQIIPAVSCLIKLQTALAGRSNRGRIYLPWVVESVTEEGKMASAVVAAMQGPWNAFVAAMAAADYQLVVASYTNSNAHDVTALTVETVTATQRRRQDQWRH